MSSINFLGIIQDVASAIKHYVVIVADFSGGPVPLLIFVAAIVWFVMLFAVHRPEPDPVEEATVRALCSSPIVRVPEADPMPPQLPEIQLTEPHASALLQGNQPTEPPAQLPEFQPTESHTTASRSAQKSEILPTSSTTSSQESDPPAPLPPPAPPASPPPTAPPAPPPPPALPAQVQRPSLRRRAQTLPATTPPAAPPPPQARVQGQASKRDSKPTWRY